MSLKRILLGGAVILGALSLTACATTDRLSYVGQTPPMHDIDNAAALTGQAGANGPTAGQAEAARLARARAIAEARAQSNNPNSLWRAANSTTFFGDPRG